ncbi:hypothetical protein F383_14604 [Gossypium arboreum]|uniref:Uncharacterized protein n=1 Tax=Gossypium arboreum TaxID=29729 RepID=A0A0B0Q177_GOSAR|nr:hypothetical protein F383_14604 [Gossypium arboreum]
MGYIKNESHGQGQFGPCGPHERLRPIWAVWVTQACEPIFLKSCLRLHGSPKSTVDLLKGQ